MKVLKLVFFSSFFIVLLVFSGCKKKYPDDRWPHTNGPLKRLSHSWMFAKYEFSTSYTYEFPSTYKTFRISFFDNGTCEGGAFTPRPNEMIYLFDFNGTWQFIENDSKIKITYPNYSKTWTIQQLDRKYLVMYCDSVKYSFTR